MSWKEGGIAIFAGNTGFGGVLVEASPGSPPPDHELNVQCVRSR
jgi:hypothetical protein